MDLYTSPDRVMTIGTFAMATGLPITTLRHYDDVGLLRPASVDERTGYRRYGFDQIERGRHLRKLRSLELSPEDMARVLDGDAATRQAVLEQHRDALIARGERIAADVGAITDYLERGLRMQPVANVRIAAINLGAKDEAELETTKTFWNTVLQTELENWGGPSWQVVLGGPEGTVGFFNIRVRAEDEPHHGHTSAFGLSVADVDETHRRAIAAGGTEHYGPTDSDNQPRHSLFSDPAGNRVVLWQSS